MLFSVSVQASAPQPYIEMQSPATESPFFLVTHSLNWRGWNRWILSLNISWISSGLAGCRAVCPACVCVSCSRDDALRFMCWQRLTVSSACFCESREVRSGVIRLVFLTVWGDFRDQTEKTDVFFNDRRVSTVGPWAAVQWRKILKYKYSDVKERWADMVEGQ